MTDPKTMTKLKMKALHDKAHTKGHLAATGHEPEPMYVVQRANPLDDTSEVVHRYEPVMDGACGFAWVTIRPGGCRFANWLKANTNARRGYHGGCEMWIGDYQQSYERKMAYAQAYAEVIREAGIDAYPGGRLD